MRPQDDEIVGGTILRIPAIQSPNYQPDTAGWIINVDGSAQFNNVTVLGTVVITNQHAILFYSGAMPSAGTLVASFSPVAGTDSFGNSYPAGMRVGATPSGGQVVVGFTGGSGFIYFPASVSNVQTPANITQFVRGAGLAAQNFIAISSPIDATQKDAVFEAFYQSSQDGTQLAQIGRAYEDPSGVFHFLETYDYTGTTIKAGRLTGTQPGTGTSPANVAVSETWHSATPLLSASWTTTGASSPLRYRYEGIGSAGIVRLDGFILTTGAGPWAANSTIFTLPAGYVPAFNKHFVNRSDIALAAGQDTVNILSSNGAVRNGQAFTAAGQQLFFDNMAFPLD